jgi:hypothetical protein
MRNLITVLGTVVVASTIISTGIFLGLRDRAVVQVIAPALPERVAAEGKAVPETNDTAGEERVVQQVRSLMAARRSEIARSCAADVKDAISLEMRLIFDAKGKLISYGVNDPEQASLLSVARCVREHRPAFSVESLGRPTTVQFALNLR